MTTGRPLDRADLVRLLELMEAKATEAGIRIELFVVGGAAMALAYDTARTTDDLDGVFVPKANVYSIARQVAAESGLDGLDPDWLNDGVKGFLPGHDPAATVLFDRPHLAVSVASPRYLFVLKAVAGREIDEEDLRVLWPLCGFASAAEAIDAIEAAYPRQQVKVAVQYLVEALAGEPDAAGS